MLPNQTEHSYRLENDENTVIYSEVNKEEATPELKKEEGTTEEVEGEATHEKREERGYQGEVEVKAEEATGRDEGVKEGLATGKKVETGECKCMYDRCL